MLASVLLNNNPCHYCETPIPIREDVAESIVAWYGHTYSAGRLPIQTVNAIEDAIPAR